MAGRIFFTLGILFVGTEFVLSDGYFGYPARDAGQRLARRCPTCPADSPESLSSPWYGSPKVYGQEISIDPSNRIFDRRPTVSIPLHRHQTQNFGPSPPTLKNIYVHPASGSSNSHEDSRPPSTNRNSPSQTSELIPHRRHEDSSTEFDSLESHDFPYDLLPSSSRLPERYSELGNAFGKPHQAPTRRVGRHYGSARENPSSEEEYEKSPNRLGAIETPSRKMVWVVYRADAAPESDLLENANFVTVPTRAEGKKVANVLYSEEPMSDSQLEKVVLRATAAATRKQGREDALYGRSRGTLRANRFNEHRREDEETSYDSAREFQSRWKKIHGNRPRETEIRQTGSHPQTMKRTYFEPSERNAGWSGYRKVVAGGGYGEEAAGTIFRTEPEVSDWEEEGVEEEKETGDFGREEKDVIEKRRNYFALQGGNIETGSIGNRKVISGRHYGNEDARIACYKKEAAVLEVPEGTGREEHSWSEETGWLGKPEVTRLPVTKSRTYFALAGRNNNRGSSRERKIMAGSHYGNEDAGIIFYEEEPEVPKVPEVPEVSEVPEVAEVFEGTGWDKHMWPKQTTRFRQPEVTRLPVTKLRTYFAPPDRNVKPGSSGNRKIISGSHCGYEEAGIIFNEEEPEVTRWEKPLGCVEVEEDCGMKIDDFGPGRVEVEEDCGMKIDDFGPGRVEVEEDCGMKIDDFGPGRVEVEEDCGMKIDDFGPGHVEVDEDYGMKIDDFGPGHVEVEEDYGMTIDDCGSEKNDEMEKPRAYLAPPERNINHGYTGSQQIMTGSHYGSEVAGVTFNEKIPEVTGREEHSAAEEIGRLGQPEVTRLPVTKQRTYFPPSVTKPRTHLASQDRNMNSGSTGNQKIVNGDAAAEIVCHRKEPEVTDRKDEEGEEKNGNDSKKSEPISSDRLRHIEQDGGSEEPEMRRKLTNYRTQSRSDEEVSAIREEDKRGDEKIVKIEESTKPPCFERKDGRDWMLAEILPDFFEDMENPPTVTEPPLRLNFDSPEASTPSPCI